MSLLALMYHRARHGPHGNSPEMLDAHLAHVARHYDCVLPGEPLRPGRLNVCLTFDDGYSDLYSTVLPLLLRHGLRAILAVAPQLIEREKSPRKSESRESPVWLKEYCSWQDLQAAVASGHVQIAAHGNSHVPLDQSQVDLHNEVVSSRNLLEERLGVDVTSFVFPYGRFTSASMALVRRHYRYVFRIGGADNGSWEGRFIYRIAADEMTAPDSLFGSARLLKYRLRRYWNIARAR